MKLDPTKLAVVRVALQKLFTQGHFSICTIRDVNAVTGNVPDGDAYTMLNALHFVDYKDMPPELRAELPKLVAKACGFGPELPNEMKPAQAEPEPQLPALNAGAVNYRIVHAPAAPKPKRWSFF